MRAEEATRALPRANGVRKGSNTGRARGLSSLAGQHARAILVTSCDKMRDTGGGEVWGWWEAYMVTRVSLREAPACTSRKSLLGRTT